MNIEIKNLTFSYGDQLIFDKADINVDDGWHLGLVGRNGRGKTTLLKILQGELPISSPLNSRKTFVYFPQELTDTSNLTLYLLQELADFEQWQLERELTLLSVNTEDVLWRPFDSLSGGEQTKCLLALLFLDGERNFPLIDEPTNHLDLSSRQIVADYLKKKSGFIVVSHDRNFLNQVTDHTLAIERQKISLYQGNFAIYEQEKKLRDDFELTENSKLRKEISRLKETAREKEEWSKNLEATKSRKKRGFDSETKRVDKGFIGRKAASMMKKSKNLEQRMHKDISEKEKLLKNLEFISPLAMCFRADHHRVLVSCEHFSLGYSSLLFEPVSFEMERGQIVALTGVNGAGKSSFVQALTGGFSGQMSGKFTIPRTITISRVRQIYDNRGALKDFAQAEKLDYELFLSNLKKLGLEREVFRQPIETMSQGQQKKVELAKSLSQEAQLYVWDEPLNYLDVFNQEQIAELLMSVKPSMILIEHDQAFIAKVCDKIVELHKI
ncbi:ABC-F type ribosomal protection-like protein Eat(A) [Lactovum odontotermitis]